jgi:hypothetical protein
LEGAKKNGNNGKKSEIIYRKSRKLIEECDRER